MGNLSWWAWGQGTMSATPLGMARVISAIANNGVMQETRFLLDETSHGRRLIVNRYAKLLRGYLREMAEHANSRKPKPENAIHDLEVGGKTGTPERSLKKKRMTKGDLTPNDGWFIFYVDNCNVPDGTVSHKTSLAIAVRLERLVDDKMLEQDSDAGGCSGVAMSLSRDLVLRVLGELGYRAK